MRSTGGRPIASDFGFHDDTNMPSLGMTDYHAAYIAHELSRRHAADSADKLAAVVAGAQVEGRLSSQEKVRHIFTIRWTLQ